MVKSVKMWQWLSPETVRGTPSRQLPQCLTTAWSIFRGCRQSANSGSLEFNIRDWHSALIFAIQRKFRQFRPQTCSLSNKWNWGTTFWKKDERLKVFAGTAVKYISGDYSRSTIVDRSKSALGLTSNCVKSLSRIRVPRCNSFILMIVNDHRSIPLFVFSVLAPCLLRLVLFTVSAKLFWILNDIFLFVALNSTGWSAILTMFSALILKTTPRDVKKSHWSSRRSLNCSFPANLLDPSIAIFYLK